MNYWKYIVCIYPTPLHKQHVTQGPFLIEVLRVWIQNFHFPKPAAILRSKKSVCPTIYPQPVEEQLFCQFLTVTGLCKNVNSLVPDLNSSRWVNFLYTTSTSNMKIYYRYNMASNWLTLILKVPVDEMIISPRGISLLSQNLRLNLSAEHQSIKIRKTLLNYS